MNRNFLLIVLSVLCFSAAQAQEYSFGVKAGANYAPTAGTVTGTNPPGITGFSTETFEADSKIGFHAGVFFELRFGKFFVRPELMYNTIDSEFDFPGNPTLRNPPKPSIYTVEKLSIPILVGYNVWGPIDVYAGPAFQKILDSKIVGTTVTGGEDDTVIVQNSKLAAQIGAKVKFGSFEAGVRYDRSLASKESDENLTFDGGKYGINTAGNNDLRVHQILVSISLKLFNSESNTGRRRSAQSCYF